jgi:hypothetical protein
VRVGHGETPDGGGLILNVSKTADGLVFSKRSLAHLRGLMASCGLRPWGRFPSRAEQPA